MATRNRIRVGITTFSAADQRRLLEESITYWQKAGPTAIWDATCEATAGWLAARGIDPTTRRVDRTTVGVLPVPWAKRPEAPSR
jgi:hypothetical protein